MLPENASTLLVAAAIIAGLYVLLRSRASPTAAAPRRAPLTSRERPADESPADGWQWQVALHDTARELKGQLDCKMSALQALVALARRESERLEQAIRRAEALHLAVPDPPDTPRAPTMLARLQALGDPAALADASALTDLAAQIAAEPPADLFASNHSDLELARLANQGLPAAEIASRLALPLGEVELRLSLRPV